jgi:DNA topoisomerase-1
VRHDGKYVSIPKDLAPAEISLEQAIQLIDAKRTEEKNRVVKVFEGDDELRIMNGRYGMYIVYQSANYKIPKTVENPAELTREEAMSIVENQEAKPAKKTGRSTRKAAEPKEPTKKESAKKETAKKTTAKKTTAKKAATTKKTSTKK